MKDTRFELVEELQKLNRPELAYLMKEALAGEFHDFLNNKYPAPKMALVQKLEQHGLKELVEEVKNGEYDESSR